MRCSLMKNLRFPASLGLVLMVAMLGGCASLPGGPQPPNVSLADVQPLDMGLFEQRYRLRLRIQNPNAEPLRVQAMDYALELNGRDFGRGVSPRPFIVPGYGEEVVTVDVVSNISRVLDQVLGLGGVEQLSYRLSGSLRVADAWFGRVPFEYRGDLSLTPGAGG